MIRASLVGISLMGVVDRVEGDLAIVEWSTGEWSDIPQALWAAPPLEGDHMTLKLRARVLAGTPARTGQDSRLQTAHGTLDLPESCLLSPNQPYQLRIRARQTQRTPQRRGERPSRSSERLSDVDHPVRPPCSDTTMSDGEPCPRHLQLEAGTVTAATEHHLPGVWTRAEPSLVSAPPAQLHPQPAGSTR